MIKDKKLLVVLGAHRSGTSLCSAALEYLGADLCLQSRYNNEENPKGFFEHPDIVDFNNQLLQSLGGSWDNPLFDGPQAIRAMADSELEIWLGRATGLFAIIFQNSICAAIKDPRFCQLLEFWCLVWDRLGYQPRNIYFIHMLRDPAEVAHSHQKRSLDTPEFYCLGSDSAEGAVLWMSLTTQALGSVRDLENVWHVAHRDFFQDPVRVLRSLSSFCGLTINPEIEQEFSQRFIDQSLYRSSRVEDCVERLQEVFPQALDFYSRLQPMIEIQDLRGLAKAASDYNREDTRHAVQKILTPVFSRLSDDYRAQRVELDGYVKAVQSIQEQREEHRKVNRELRNRMDELQADARELQEQLANQAAALELEVKDKITLEHRAVDLESHRDTLAATIEQIKMSRSWRWTSSMRRLGNLKLRGSVKLSAYWSRIRVRSILIYHRLSIRNPRLAWSLRRMLRPAFRIATRVFSHPVTMDSSDSCAAGILKPMQYQQTEASSNFRPLVSVIVPNFNHAAYLALRLDSIFSQSYSNFEVILLDDSSTDESTSILEEYQRRYASKTTLVVNESNSGGVFKQWQKGLEAAQGDLVWMAESDDWCSANFLEALVPYFENEAIQLAYTRTVFMDAEGDQQIWSINDYLHDIDAHRWNHEIIETGPQIVKQAFAQKNIIPNVSSALFRNPRHLALLSDPAWQGMSICGDWIFYLHLIRGGMIAYTPAACNYYRIHGKNTSVAAHTADEFYREHQTVAETLARYYDPGAGALEQLRDHLIVHWRETRPRDPVEGLDRCFDLKEIQSHSNPRPPNLLMVSYGFCTGGGETFPVSLANLMKGRGYNVTYLDCAREPRNEGVRQRLRSDIPIVSDFPQLENIVRNFEIDVIHSHHAWADSTVLDLLPDSLGCKTVVTLHGMYETINELDLKVILPRLVQRSSRLIYVADKNLSAIDRMGLLQQARIERIDNALEDEPYEQIHRAELDIPEGAFVLALVSRAMEEKGWAEGIQAVSSARNASGKDIHLLLVGDGPEYERLLSESLPDYVHLEGFQHNVRGYFALSDVGFLPSRFKGESFPLVIIECLKAGRPVLATRLGEIPYMLDSDRGPAGVLVDLDGDDVDIPAFAEVISRLAGSCSEYRVLHSLVGAAAAKFDPKLLAQRHDAAYRSVMQEAR